MDEQPDSELQQGLEQLAGRGQARGHAEVLAGARAAAAVPPRRSQRPALAAAAAVAALVMLAAGVTAITRPGSDRRQVAGVAANGTTTTVPGDNTTASTPGPVGGTPTTAASGTPATTKPAAAGKTTTTKKAAEDLGRIKLASFTTCASVVDYAKSEALKIVSPFGAPVSGTAVPMAGVPSAGISNVSSAMGSVSQEQSGSTATTVRKSATATTAPGSTAFSGTNIQEAGVDEPDTVKTDGRTIWSLEQNKLWATTTDGTPKTVGALAFDGFGARDMLLAGNRLVLFGSTGPKAKIIVLDVRDPAAMKIVDTLTVDGNYVSGRLVDGVARVVVNSFPSNLNWVYPKDNTEAAQKEALEKNKAVITHSGQANWLPTLTVADPAGRTTATRPATDCDNTYRPQVFAGFSMLTVLTVDPARPDKAESTSVLGGGNMVYSSAGSLYVATTGWAGVTSMAVRLGPDTQIHKFDISDSENTTYRASGKVAGTVLNQYSFSEYKDDLRVATTTFNTGGTESSVVVLRQDGEALNAVGQVGGLGKGERIYAVRFVDDVGYVVTFRQVDPLYTIDLSDPKNPRVVGELKILGYSAYLHPIGDGLLLGVGQDANEQARRSGAQVSVFDVSDPANPQLLQKRSLGNNSNTAAEFDPHAFLWWAPTRLTVLPMSSNSSDGGPPFMGAVGMTVGADTIEELGRLSHPAPNNSPIAARIDRSVVIGDSLYTVSVAGVQRVDLANLANPVWSPFQ